MNSNLTSLQENFVKDSVIVRLTRLSTHLKLIQSLFIDSADINTVNQLIRESRFFTEWIGLDIDIDHAYQLANLGRFLTRWLFNWEYSWNDTTARNQIVQELGTWVDSVSNMSQLPVMQSK